MSTVARHIKRRRSELFMTQDNLAEQLFVTRQTVSNWETGRSQPDIDTLVRIAEVLKTDASALIYGPPQERNRKGALRGLCISGGITLLLGLTYIIGMPIGRKLMSQYYLIGPNILVYAVVLPMSLLALSWTLLQGLWTVGLLNPFRKAGKIPYRITLGLFLLLFLPVLLVGVEGMVDFVQVWNQINSPVQNLSTYTHTPLFPEFIYQFVYGFFWGWRRVLFLSASFFFGMALWLTKPRNNPKETIGSNTENNLNPTGEK